MHLKLFGLVGTLVLLLSGCGATGWVGAAPTPFVCPPIPTPTLDPRPTTTPFSSTAVPVSKAVRATAAPQPTQGPPPPFETPAPPPTLAVALTSPELVLAHLFRTQKYAMDQWQEPWCPEMLTYEPSRFAFARYATLDEAEGGGRRFGGDYEPAWKVTIFGKVDPVIPGCGMVNCKSAYITFVIGENSGMIYGLRTGNDLPLPTDAPYVTRPPRTPRTRVPRTPRATATP